MFDIRSYRSESDHDSDIVCRICFPDVDLFVRPTARIEYVVLMLFFTIS